MSSWQLSRRTLLRVSAASAAGAIVGAPALVRAEVKEVVIGGPAGAAKYFNADAFPIIEKALGIKVIYEGTNSLTNLQKMIADRMRRKCRSSSWTIR
jgi:putative spermidine/putrescine transport system substrate-binding protein